MKKRGCICLLCLLIGMLPMAVKAQELQGDYDAGIIRDDKGTTLQLSGRNLENLDLLEGMDLTGITTLDLSYNQLTSLYLPEKVKGLESVEELILSYNRLTDLQGLEAFPNLRRLSLTGNAMGDLSGLYSLKQPERLHTLYVSDCGLTELTGVEILTGLETLSAGDNLLTDLTGVSVLKSLRFLFAENNRIESLEGLNGLGALESAELRTNCLTDLEGLGELPALKQLSLSENSLASLEGIQKLPNVQSLQLNSNPGLQDVSLLSDLDLLESVRLDDTGVSDADILRLAGFRDIQMKTGESARLNRITILLGSRNDFSAEGGGMMLETETAAGMVRVDITARESGNCLLTIRLGEEQMEVKVSVEAESSYVKGDLTNDGKVQIDDLRMLLRAVCQKIQLTEQQAVAADVVEDGKADIQDLRKLLRFICRKIDTL